jgi:hypothetical protein
LKVVTFCWLAAGRVPAVRQSSGSVSTAKCDDVIPTKWWPWAALQAGIIAKGDIGQIVVDVALSPGRLSRWHILPIVE